MHIYELLLSYDVIMDIFVITRVQGGAKDEC